ncbi:MULTISPECIES: M48 family metallopeptidase [unclassified Pseudomonas]|uniref:M48 family metallopeptidase n=1 Tax=unclassified Pseudomonas TaxID=196821 RepID=UPI000A1E3215|nr:MULTISPECIES: M48 family metallopeptidase [unclassified Pseudomonas]MDI2143280.1 M48 family metallopeptidase [Pseudomonas sp. ITA]
MNFFERQTQARNQTSRLIYLMILAIVMLIGMTSLPFVFNGFEDYLSGTGTLADAFLAMAVIALFISSIVVIGGLLKYRQLRAGGKVVAEKLGGRLLNGNARTLGEQRLMNVVEEMAIASGTCLPAVYLLPDESINAFAAGFTPEDAAIGVTRGAVKLLTREELQGVIAHEFSHIFNGDMRLNTQLVAVVHGLLVLGLAGTYILASLLKRDKRDVRLMLVVFALGAALCVAGFIGNLYGNLIKAAVSRQREFLADASAVQYTRNPQSIVGALKKIGAHAQGSVISSPRAAEFSHLFFSTGGSGLLSRMFATHPDLSVRIRRIDPQWDGSFTTGAAPSTPDQTVKAVVAST